MVSSSRAAGAITNYLAPTNTIKRKAVEGDGSEKENSPTLTEVEPPQKKAKSGSTTAIAATGAKAAKTAKPKAGSTPKKLFNDTVKAIAKAEKKLDQDVKKQDPNDKYGLNIENYVDIATEQLDVVKDLAKSDVGLAWNLILHLGDISAVDMGRHFRMCGYGDHERGFAELDQAMLELVEKRTLPEVRLEVLSEVPHRWTRADADVGEFKTGRPNKQQRNQMDRDKNEWEKARRENKMDRRMECEDWVAVALADLKGERDYLDAYGVEGFFKESIAKLEALDQARKVPT